MSDLEGKSVRGYRLDITIGSGGFGTVYHAYQEVLNREVAVKVINEKYANQAQFIRQFEAEARIIARLEHLHIVSLYDYWREPSGAYLVMRWLKGGSLRSILRQSQLTIPQTVRMLNQVASSLSFAHSQNVIHRDIKPENILLDDLGNVFLTDFGIAVDLRNQENLDVEHISFGSPDYVAPEQLTEHLITPQADIYSLGIMLYELLARERPFRGESAKEIMKMQLNNPVPSLRLARPDLPPEIDTVIWQATAKRPSSRYDNVLELAVAFQNIAAKIADVPPDYTISTEMRQKNSPLKPRQAMDLQTEAFATGSLMTESFESFGEDVGTGTPVQLDAMETGILDPQETGVLEDYRSFPTSDFREQDFEGEVIKTMALIGEGPSNPYKGLRPFEEADADTFYGREELVRRLVSAFENPEKRFLALIGPSGSGKSSVVKAGMMPAFRRGAVKGSQKWFMTSMVPSDDPFREMSEALMRVARHLPDDWGTMLRKSPQGLYKLLDLILPIDGKEDKEEKESSELLLFIDQFEEVFTQSEDEESRVLFLGSLWYALNQPNSRLRLIITLRADFYDRPLYYPQFGELLQKNTEVVLPLNLQELEAAILRPAHTVGLMIEPALTNAILQDVQGQPGALPLLQYALTEMYERREGHRLGYEEYVAIGGISGALAKRAEEIFYNRLDDKEQSLARQLFLRIVTIDENGTAVRRRIVWSELMAGVENRESLAMVVDAFSRHRLLTTDRDPVTRSPTVEIAHEALINGWQQLRQWIEQNRAALQKRQELRSEVDRWLGNSREKSYLASGVRLGEFEGLVNNTLLALRPEETDYIQTAIETREAGIRRTKQINAALTVFSIVTGILAIVAGISFFFANAARTEAEEARSVADEARIEAEEALLDSRSRELAANSIATQDENDLSMLLAVEAVNVGQTYEAVNSLLLSLQVNPYLSTYLQGHTERVLALDISSTGEMAVSASFDNSLIRWDMISYEPIGEPLLGHEFGVNTVAFSPDDRIIASGAGDSTIRLWDSATGESLAVWDAGAPVATLAFSPDGSRIYSGDRPNGTLLVWDVESGEILQRMDEIHLGGIDVIEASPNGRRFVSGGGDGMARLWDAETFEPVAELAAAEGWVRALTFNRDGSSLFTAGDNSLIMIWDGLTGEKLNLTIQTFTGGINDLAYTPNAEILAWAGANGSMNLYNFVTQTYGEDALTAHNGAVYDLEFDPRRFALLSGAFDSKLIYWTLSSVQHPGTVAARVEQTISDMLLYQDLETVYLVLAGQEANATNSNIIVSDGQGGVLYEFDLAAEIGNGSHVVFDTAISPDGTLLAAALRSGYIATWDLRDGDMLWAELEHEAIAKGVVFAPNNTLYSVDELGQILRWNIDTGDASPAELSFPEGEAAGVTAFAISSDGRYLAFVGRDSRIIVWDLTDMSLVNSFIGHNEPVDSLLFDATNGRLISGGRDDRIVIWDVETGSSLRVLEGQEEWVISLALSPNGQYLASGDRDGGVRLWEYETGRSLGTWMRLNRDWVSGLVFTDENHVLSSHRDSGILVSWTFSLDDWLTMACNVSNRSLSEEEWRRYFPDADYAPQCSS
jgi:WD40 repeat protein/serine/threonine protein kinase